MAHYNPVTYLLAALRSLIMVGWDGTALWQGVVAVALVGVVSQSLAFSGAARSGAQGLTLCWRRSHE